jgi:hypothetical protein
MAIYQYFTTRVNAAHYAPSNNSLGSLATTAAVLLTGFPHAGGAAQPILDPDWMHLTSLPMGRFRPIGFFALHAANGPAKSRCWRPGRPRRVGRAPARVVQGGGKLLRQPNAFVESPQRQEAGISSERSVGHFGWMGSGSQESNSKCEAGGVKSRSLPFGRFLRASDEGSKAPTYAVSLSRLPQAISGTPRRESQGMGRPCHRPTRRSPELARTAPSDLPRQRSAVNHALANGCNQQFPD